MATHYKTIKTRKDHICDYCLRPIIKGSECLYTEYRYAICDDNDRQTSIGFYKGWFCIDVDECCKIGSE